MSYFTNNQPQTNIPIWAQPGGNAYIQNAMQPANYVQQPVTQNWNQPTVNHLFTAQQSQPIQSQQNQLFCRVISSEEDIQPAEVPGNGSIAFFVSTDLSKIYAKQWNKVGGIDTLVFEQKRSEPEIVVSEKQEPSQEYTNIIGKLNDIFDLLNVKNEPVTNTTKISKSNKKEEGTNA